MFRNCDAGSLSELMDTEGTTGRGLGDVVEQALSLVGVTKKRVRKWLKKCHCEERQQQLNQLGWWAERVVKGQVDKAREYLEELLSTE